MKKLCMLTLCSSAVLGAVMMTEEMNAATWAPNTIDTIKAEMKQQQGDKQKLAVYRVQKGDTLSGIAEAAGLTINKILEMNDIPNPNMIHIGQLINLGYSSQANNFVAQKGQSVQHNAKSYSVPTSQKAQASMATTNANQTVASKPVNNQYKPVYNQTAQQKPVANNGGSQASQGTVNNGGSSVTVDVPATGGQQAQKPSTNKPTTGGQTNTQKPTTPTKPVEKPSTGENQGTQQGYDLNEINKRFQNNVSSNGWTGQWMTENGYDNSDDSANGWTATNIPADFATNKNVSDDLTEAFIDAGSDKTAKEYKYGYSETTIGKNGYNFNTDYYFWN